MRRAEHRQEIFSLKRKGGLYNKKRVAGDNTVLFLEDVLNSAGSNETNTVLDNAIHLIHKCRPFR